METSYLTCQKCSKKLDWEKDMESWEKEDLCLSCYEE